MTTTPIRFNLADARAAFDRIENDAGLPGDETLAAQYEGWNDQEYDRWQQAQWDAQYARELAEWLSTRCGGCEDGGTGEDCYEHAPYDEDDEQPEPLVLPANWPPRDGDVWADATGTRWGVEVVEVNDEVRTGFHQIGGNTGIAADRLLETAGPLRLVSGGWYRAQYGQVAA